MGRTVLRCLSIAVALACLLPGAPARADSHEGPMPLLWVSYITAEPGKSQELGMHLIDGGKKIYDGLVADGHAVNWGVAQGVNHFPGDDWTHLEWVSFTGWAGVNEFVRRFIAGQQAKAPDQLAEEAARWAELTVSGSHYDEIARFIHVSPQSDERPSYISLSYMGTRNVMDSMRKVPGMYKKWRAPFLDKLQAEGKIMGHGAFALEVHPPDSTWSVAGYVAMSGLGAIDEMRQAENAHMASMSAEDRQEWMEAMGSTFDFSGHHDRILAVLHYHAAAMASGEGGGGDEGGE